MGTTLTIAPGASRTRAAIPSAMVSSTTENKLAEQPTENDQLGIEQVDEVADAHSRASARPGRTRRASPARRCRHRRSSCRAGTSAAAVEDRAGGRNRASSPASVSQQPTAPAPAAHAAGLTSMCPGLAGVPGGAQPRLATEDDPEADPDLAGHEQQVGDTGIGAAGARSGRRGRPRWPPTRGRRRRVAPTAGRRAGRRATRGWGRSGRTRRRRG